MDRIQYTTKEGSSLMVPVFNGRIIDKMPELVARGCTPISCAEIMQQRVIAWQSGDERLAQLWEESDFNSGDGIMYHPDGRIKIVPDSENVRSVNSDTPLEWQGHQVLAEGTFNNVQGEEFSKEYVEKFTNKRFEKGDVLDNPIWLAFARGDRALLKEYVDIVYSRYLKEVTWRGENPGLMSIWVNDCPDDFEVEGHLYFDSIFSESDICGNIYNVELKNDNSKLVGVPPKVYACDKVVETKINLEALIRDFRILAYEGFLTPKAQELYVALQDGEYNL